MHLTIHLHLCHLAPMPGDYHDPDHDRCNKPDFLLDVDLAAREDLNGGRPVKLTPERGISLMQSRIQLHRENIENAIATAESNPGLYDEMMRFIAQQKQLLTTAQARLREYQTQLGGKN